MKGTRMSTNSEKAKVSCHRKTNFILIYKPMTVKEIVYNLEIPRVSTVKGKNSKTVEKG